MPFRRRHFAAKAMVLEIIRRATSGGGVVWGSVLPPSPAALKAKKLNAQVLLTADDQDPRALAIVAELQATLTRISPGLSFMDGIVPGSGATWGGGLAAAAVPATAPATAAATSVATATSSLNGKAALATVVVILTPGILVNEQVLQNVDAALGLGNGARQDKERGDLPSQQRAWLGLWFCKR